jgi:hypothetical protein
MEIRRRCMLFRFNFTAQADEPVWFIVAGNRLGYSLLLDDAIPVTFIWCSSIFGALN